MTRRSIVEYAAAVRRRYILMRKAERTRLLDEFCQTTGYHRKAAIRLLRPRSARVLCHGRVGTPDHRGCERRYGSDVAAALTQVWEAGDRMCSKRLAPFLPELVAALERHGELVLDAALRAQVLRLSPATIDRLLKPRRTPDHRRPYTQGTASATLKGQIPIRTFGDWAEVTPGSVQADLVMHCGESTNGFYLATLDAVDVATGWTECQVVWGKGQERVGAAAHYVRERLPFALRELHTDNGGEFLNAVLYPWCQRTGVRVTRGRPYKKNDQAYVEQKNWSVIRRLVGYDRYSTKAAQAAFEQLYAVVRLYVNYFQPVRKRIGKERVGAKVVKRYDTAQTPYQRLLTTNVLTEERRQTHEREYLRLNPVRLRAQMDAALEALWKLADRAQPPRTDAERAAGADGELSTDPSTPEREKKERSKERKEKGAATTAATTTAPE